MDTSATTILLAPAAAGKTTAVLAALAAPRRGWAYLVVPSGLHRDRLMPQLADVPRVRVAQLSRLASNILRRGGVRLNVAHLGLRARLLRAELLRLAHSGALSHFAAVAHKPGFAVELLRLIDELQAAELDPAALAAAAVSPYDADLAAIYAAYRARLTRLNYVDEAGLLACTRDLLRTDTRLARSIALLVVDGFDQLTPLQLSLLQTLAAQVRYTLITLTGSPQPRTAHRRFTRTLAALQSAFPGAQISWLPDTSRLTAPALVHIEARLFELEPAAPIDAGAAIRLINAPDRERELRAALRHVRHLLSKGIAAEQVALIYRSGESYLPLMREIADEYELPLAFNTGRTLAEAPPVIALLQLLSLPLADYPRRALVESWRNLASLDPACLEATGPLLPNFGVAAQLLDQATRAAGLAGGLDRLRTCLQAIVDAELPAADDLAGPVLSAAQARSLIALLDAFAVWLSPPPIASLPEYIDWLSIRLDLKGSEVEEGAQDPPALFAALPFSPTQLTRLQLLLEELLNDAILLVEPPLTYAAFVAELGAQAAAAHYGHQAPQPGKVAVLDALSSRGSAFDHVLLLGLVEGEFPASLPALPFYTRRERALLASRGLPLPPPDPADERSLFYEVVTRARLSLTLSYTRLDESGNPLLPSPYLRDLLDLFIPQSVPTREIRAGSPPDLEDAVSLQEQLIAAMEHHASDFQSSALNPQSSALAAHVAHACAVERTRESPDPCGPYEGLLDDPRVSAALAAHFGPQHRWSVTQVNDYTTCPFRFLAAHVLHLESRSDPEEGLAQVGRGRLYHAILARAGERWARRQIPAAAEHEAVILEDLAAAAAEVLDAAPTTYGFVPGPFWAWEQEEVQRLLARALHRTLRDPGDWDGFRPAGVEQSFGMGAGAPALRVSTDAGEALIIGRIDRIDQDAAGNLALIDYKSGGSPRPLDETLNGRDIQLTIYILATEQLLAPNQQVTRAAFFHLGSGRRSRALTNDERPQAEAALRERLGAALEGTRGGRFVVQPSGDCPPTCAYAVICRLNKQKHT